MTEERSDASMESAEGAPVRHGEEWANAATHGLATVLTFLLGWYLVTGAMSRDKGLAVSCVVYVISVAATFGSSTLSHSFLKQPLLDRLRALDQASIYAMISGTYTPIIYRFAPETLRSWLLVAIWIAAASGIFTKLLFRHRVNNITTLGYLLLGWLPSIPLISSVPSGLGWGMLGGGVLYSLGVMVLINDHRRPFLHALWHLIVMSAATCHFAVILIYVVGS